MDLNLTIEKVSEILKSDDAMPKAFTVVEVVYSPELDVCFAKWIDDAEYDEWENAMSDGSSPDVARNIEAFKPVERYSGVWENDDPEAEDEKTYSVQIFAGKELKEMIKDVSRLTPVCKA
jgi:hypothetical protein